MELFAILFIIGGITVLISALENSGGLRAPSQPSGAFILVTFIIHILAAAAPHDD
jgi:hypothetical protein